MTDNNNTSTTLKTYVFYISLSVLFTTILNIIHTFFLHTEDHILIHVMPTLAGVIFGYLITKVIILNYQLKKLATVDKLTGAYNRMHFDQQLHEEIEKANRYNDTFSLTYMDLDHFKKINDEYGHATGDYVLATVGKIVKKQNRKSDIFARYGGEEFVILTPVDCDPSKDTHAERLRRAINHYNFNKVGKISCSFGCTQFRNNEDTAEDILKRADQALYEAKADGRNCAKYVK